MSGWGGGLYVFSIVVIEMTPNRQPAKFKGCHKFVNLSSFLFGLYYIERERHCNITVCMASIYTPKWAKQGPTLIGPYIDDAI
jgi:hypothetical protein